MWLRVLITLTSVCLPWCSEGSCPRNIRLAGLPPKETTLSIWNYFGQRNFDSAAFVQLSKTGDGFYSSTHGTASISGSFLQGATFRRLNVPFEINPALTEVTSGSIGPTLLDRNQFFPLQIMQDTGYIGPELREMQVGIPPQIHPDQLLFIEATTDRTGEELLNHFGAIPAFARVEPWHHGIRSYLDHFELGETEPTPNELLRSTQHQLKEGSLWVMSGQPLGRTMPLFLEWPGLIRKLDRTEFPYVWEIGRAAQISNRAFYDSLSAALYFVSRELILLGGNLDNAYLFGHSLNARLGSVYRRAYGMKDFSKYDDSDEGMAHFRTLKEALAAITRESINPLAAAVVRASESKLSSHEAVGLYLYSQQCRTEYLSSSDTKVIQLRDFSPLSTYLIDQKAREALPESRETTDVIQRLSDIPPLQEHRDFMVERVKEATRPYSLLATGRFVPKGLQNLDEYLKEFSAIEVSSPDNVSAEELLIVAYRRAIERLVEQGESDPKQKLVELGVHFALVNRSYPGSTGPDWYIHRPEIRAAGSFVVGNEHVLRKEISMSASIYSASRVAEISQGKTVPLFTRGQAHLRQYLSNPGLMGF